MNPRKTRFGRMTAVPPRPPRRLLMPILSVALGGVLVIAACDNADPKPKITVTADSAFGAYLAARQASRRNDAAAAAQFYARALADDPGNTVIMTRAILAYVRAGYMGDAVKLSERLAKAEPDNGFAMTVLIAHDARDKDFKAMKAHVEKLTTAGPNVLLKPLLEAWAAYGTGDVKAADAALTKLDRVPAFANFRDIHGGLIHDLAGNNAEAEARLLAAYNRQTLVPFRIVTAVALVQARLGKKAEAIKAIDAYLDVNPESLSARQLKSQIEKGDAPKRMISSVRDGVGEVFFNLASALNEERSAAQALFFARLAAHVRAGDTPSVFMVATILERQSQFEAAIEAYRQVPKSSPVWWEAQKSIASSLAQLERHAEAAKHLEELAKEKPDRWDVLALLGNLHRSQKQWAKAVDAYDRAFRLIGTPERRHANLLYVRGIALERAKQWPRAEADFKLSLKLKPDEPYVLNYLAYSWVERGENLAEAEEMLKKAVSLRRNDGFIVDSLGWVYYRTGRFKEAVPLLERAAELQPEDPTINDHLGDALWRVGRKSEALVQWRRALSLSPEKDVAEKIRQKLKSGMEPFTPVTEKPAPGKESPGAPGSKDK